MKIATFSRDGGNTIEAVTADEFAAATQEFRNSWDEWVWQNQPDKETAIERHDEAFTAWRADDDAGRPFKDFY